MRLRAAILILAFALPVCAEASAPVAKEFTGVWEGGFDLGGHIGRYILHLSNEKDGATGYLLNYDQGGAESPISAIEQNGSHIRIELRVLEAVLEFDLSGDGKTLAGTFNQIDDHYNLVMTKTGK